MEEKIMEEKIMEEKIMEETTMEETTISASDRLAQVEAERKKLREQVTKEQSEKLINAKNFRRLRDSKVKEVSAVLVKVQKEIFAYNKSGKKARGKLKVLEAIAKLVEYPNAKEIATEQVEESEADESTTETTSFC